jgi:hypothetical protein
VIRLYDVVRMCHDHPAEHVAAGTVGTVVHVAQPPAASYVVEIADRQGRTRALVSVTPDEVEPAGSTIPGVAAGG